MNDMLPRNFRFKLKAQENKNQKQQQQKPVEFTVTSNRAAANLIACVNVIDPFDDSNPCLTAK